MAPVSSCQIETARFDTQKLENPEIRGTGYQQGTLAGYELREYLLEKWERKCAYCGRVGVPLEIEHIVVRSRGGSNRAGNLTLSCRPCDEAKGRMEAREFLKGRPERLARLLAQAKAPLRDAAAVNATRYAVGDAVKGMGLPTSFCSGGGRSLTAAPRAIPRPTGLMRPVSGKAALPSGLTVPASPCGSRPWAGGRVKWSGPSATLFPGAPRGG